MADRDGSTPKGKKKKVVRRKTRKAGAGGGDATHETFARLYEADKVRRDTRDRGSFTSAYPVEKRDPLQKAVDPIVNNIGFQVGIFGLIIYSLVNLVQSYTVGTPEALARVHWISFGISAVFMTEFVLKFCSRRWAYVKREGVVDFLAAADVFSPAIRAAKFVRFLRILRLLRLVRGVRMVNKRKSRIEDDVFTHFSTAVIVVMLIFIAAGSLWYWNGLTAQVHEGLAPTLLAAELGIETGEDGALTGRAREHLAGALAAIPTFVHAAHKVDRTLTESTDWRLAAERTIRPEPLAATRTAVETLLAERRSALGFGDRALLRYTVLGALDEGSSAEDLRRARQAVYVARQEADGEEVLAVLDRMADLLQAPDLVAIERQTGDAAATHLKALREARFEEEFLTVRREIPEGGGAMEYVFAVSDEWRDARSAELGMLGAAFALIVVMVLALNYALRGILHPIAELDDRMQEVIDTGKFVPIRFRHPPQNELQNIADNVNDLVGQILLTGRAKGKD